MISKNLGFIRNLTLPWLDMTAAFLAETDDLAEIRARLDYALSQEIRGAEARRKTIDVLLGTWHKSAKVAPDLHAEALQLFRTVEPGERLWLHWGLTLVQHPLFRDCAVAIGQAGRRGDAVTTAAIKQRMAASRGQVGDLKRSVERILASMRNWGVLEDSGQRFTYTPKQQALMASSSGLELWLLACALKAHPAEEIPFADLVRLPELFPFRFTVTLGDVRRDSRFSVQRQGAGWNGVRLAD